MRLTLPFVIIYFLISCNAEKRPPAKKHLQNDGPKIDYSNQSVKILRDGSFIEGKEKIALYNRENPLSVDSLNKIFSVKANDQFVYEIHSTRSQGIPYKQITISEVGNTNNRALELITQADTANLEHLKEQISARRDEWIERCNQHNAEDLITEMYLIEAIYFNHKPVIANQDSLIKEYGYMNRPNYSLHLKPLHVEMVTNNLAYEIGQCSGSYGGKYIIIWTKDKNDKWSVMADSNI
ncbi:MAG: hypothetical protein AAFN93_20440 [Bacteroidota bacterium]